MIQKTILSCISLALTACVFDYPDPACNPAPPEGCPVELRAAACPLLDEAPGSNPLTQGQRTWLAVFDSDGHPLWSDIPEYRSMGAAPLPVRACPAAAWLPLEPGRSYTVLAWAGDSRCFDFGRGLVTMPDGLDSRGTGAVPSHGAAVTACLIGQASLTYVPGDTITVEMYPPLCRVGGLLVRNDDIADAEIQLSPSPPSALTWDGIHGFRPCDGGRLPQRQQDPGATEFVWQYMAAAPCIGIHYCAASMHLTLGNGTEASPDYGDISPWLRAGEVVYLSNRDKSFTP